MKTPDEMKEFLMHPEERIRQFTLDYFDEAQSDDEELLPLLLRACDMAEAVDVRRGLLHSARELVVTATGASELCRRIKSEPELETSYAAALLASSPHVLTEVVDELAQLPAELHRKLERRINLVQLSTADLIRQWWRFAASIRGEDYYTIDFSFVVAMAREISRRQDLPDMKLSDVILKYQADDSDDWDEHYEDVMACVLAGYLQDESAVPALLDVLTSDIDLLQERAMYALVRIGTERIVDAVEQRFRESEWDFQNYATGVLAGIKTSVSEAATVRLFEQATDIEERLMLADTLCSLISATEIPAMKKLLQDSDDSVDLMESLHANCVLNGIDDEDVRNWKVTLGEIDAAFERRIRFEKEMEARPHKKVGRNEPCPCGSGKKYKKCCGA